MFDKLTLTNVRAHKTYQTSLSSATNIVIGPNASGKTTIIESLFILSTGKSFKSPLTEIINTKSEWAKITHSANHTQEVRVKKIDGKTNKEFIFDDTTKKTFPKNQRKPVSLFEPGQLRVVTGSPERRREFFDQTISQVDTEYSQIKNNYTKALRQRNSLLKQNDINQEHMFVWDMRIAELSEKTNHLRQKLTEAVNERIEKQYKEIAGKKASIRLEYTSELTNKTKESILQTLSSNFQKDKLLGHTTFGTHRDDFSVYINDRSAASSASRGESRTIMLCLKLIEIELISAVWQEKPILLLDDVFSELDGKRRTLLTDVVSGYQSVITTTDADIVTKDFLGRSNLIPTKTN